MFNLLCLFGRHKPDYATIQTEDNAYTANCRWCDNEIIKRRHASWRKIKADPTIEDTSGRNAHPS